MRGKILEEIGEDLIVLFECVAIIQKMKNSNLQKKIYLNFAKDEIEFMLKLKKKYEAI